MRCRTLNMVNVVLTTQLFCLHLIGIGHAFVQAERPNFVILIADDISYNDIGCYGSPDARTPRIDALATEGIRLTHAYLTASSCSPSRCSIITGRYPHNNGNASELHREISSHLPSFTGILREAGYYTALAGKHHMAWGKPDGSESTVTEPFDRVYAAKTPENSGGHAYWNQALSECPPDQPFCLWLASLDAHRGWDSDLQWNESQYGPMHRPSAVHLPPAFVDTPETRQDFASYHNEVTRFDYFVGKVVDRLKAENLFDKTYLFVLADNGRPFPRAKTRLHDDGMKTYLVVTGPKIKEPGRACASLVSVIDIAPTIAALAGLERPATFQGESMLPIFEELDAEIRPFAFSEHNWHDYEALARSVRDQRWLLIRNDRPQFAMQGPADSVRSPTHQALRAAARSSQPLTPVQSDVLRVPRPQWELYDRQGDPHQVHNLAETGAYQIVRDQLASALAHWQETTGDDSPEVITPDSFDRQTGQSLGYGKRKFEQMKQPYVGRAMGADRINAKGY